MGRSELRHERRELGWMRASLARRKRPGAIRVAVTGVGMVSPLGLDAPSTWRAACAGESGVDWIRAFDTTGLPIRIAGEVKGFEGGSVASPKDARKLDRNVLLALGAAREAWADGGLRGFDPARVGIIFGSAAGGITTIAEQAIILHERGFDRVSPTFIPNMLADTASGQLAIALGIKGVNYAIVSSCATGSHVIGEAAEIIRRGEVDAMLAGSTEACINPLILAGFTAMRGLAPEDDEPAYASRPFDATRAGFVLSEGAGAVLLEPWDCAEARGASIYAEVLGYGVSNDAHHLAQPEPEAEGVAAMMRGALARSAVAPEQIGYINAHGTSTPLGDAAETKAIRDVFGAHAYELAVSSTKSMMGHTFGAAGAIEAILTMLAMRDGVLPPTINQARPDPACDLDFVPNVARHHASVEFALSNTMGLGGHNGCLLLRRA